MWTLSLWLTGSGTFHFVHIQGENSDSDLFLMKGCIGLKWKRFWKPSTPQLKYNLESSRGRTPILLYDCIFPLTLRKTLPESLFFHGCEFFFKSLSTATQEIDCWHDICACLLKRAPHVPALPHSGGVPGTHELNPNVLAHHCISPPLPPSSEVEIKPNEMIDSFDWWGWWNSHHHLLGCHFN